jgi:dCMP deaminase
MEDRIHWDDYFLKMAEVTALRSACLSNKKGCVIVSGNRVLSTGYNGPPSGVLHCNFRCNDGSYPETRIQCGVIRRSFVDNQICPRQRMGFKSGEGLEFCPASHAETNAITLAARGGVCIEDAFMYCSFHEIPCRECAKLLLNAGIRLILLNGTPLEYPEPGITGKMILDMGKLKYIDGRHNV